MARAEVEHVCECCDGAGTIDLRLGGESFSDPEAECPDCNGKGYWLDSDGKKAKAHRLIVKGRNLKKLHKPNRSK